MANFLEILRDVILPIFVLVGAGVYLERRFKLDINTLVKLNFYIFVPALIFTKIIESNIDWSGMLVVGLFQAVLIFALLLLNLAVVRALKFSSSLGACFLMATIFCNSGNFGIPLVHLAFPAAAATAVSYQAVTIMIHNFLTFTLGLVIIGGGRASIAQSLKYTLKLPFIYVMVAALVLKRFDIPVTKWPWFWSPFKYAGDGLVAVALLTLGVQIAKTPRVRHVKALSATLLMRLAAAPLLAFGLVKFFDFFYPMPTLLKQLVVIAAAAPAAVNTVLISIEFKNEPEYAASAVFYTTVLSGLTAAVTIFLVRSFM